MLAICRTARLEQNHSTASALYYAIFPPGSIEHYVVRDHWIHRRQLGFRMVRIDDSLWLRGPSKPVVQPSTQKSNTRRNGRSKDFQGKRTLNPQADRDAIQGHWFLEIITNAQKGMTLWISPYSKHVGFLDLLCISLYHVISRFILEFPFSMLSQSGCQLHHTLLCAS
jgi:hypothetical protein